MFLFLFFIVDSRTLNIEVVGAISKLCYARMLLHLLFNEVYTKTRTVRQMQHAVVYHVLDRMIDDGVAPRHVVVHELLAEEVWY